ncbi:WD domain protein [Morchella snyderi]|nr:WD domain protein [Morchella snyderi]
MPQILNSTSSSNLSCPEGTYIYGFASANPGSLGAICSDDSLRLFSPETLALQRTFGKVHDGVRCLEAVDTNILATAGLDGAVRVWDVRSQADKPGMIYKNISNASVLSLAVNAGANVLAGGTELVEGSRIARVVIWDLRTADTKVQYTESHNDDVTELQFHPTMPHILLSGSTDALVNMYNLLTPPSTTKTTPDDDVDEALYQVINHGYPIHHAGFLAPSNDIYALSDDQNLGMYKFVTEIPEDEEKVLEEAETKSFGDLRLGLGCDYIVDVVQHKAGGGLIVSGSNNNQWLDLVPLRKASESIGGWHMVGEDGVRLNGGHGEEVVRGIYLDDKLGTIYTGGEDGLVKVWKEPTGGDSDVASTKKEKAEKKRLKEERKEKKEAKARYKPY